MNYKKIRSPKKLKIRICPPPWAFKYPIYNELEYFIKCSNSNEIFPRRWSELELDFSDKNKRVCTILNNQVCLVSNIHNYNENKDIQEYLAIPINSPLFKKLYDEIKDDFLLFRFIQITRRLIQGSGYRAKYDIQTSNKDEAILWAIEYLKNAFETYSKLETKEKKAQRVIEHYQELGVDLKTIFELLKGQNFDLERFEMTEVIGE